MKTIGWRLVMFAVLAMASWTSQAQTSPRRIGILINGGPSPLFDSIKRNLLSDFSSLGYHEGRDIVIELRFADLKLDRLPGLASELASTNVDIILALGGPASVAAQKATTTIPIVFSIVTDPVALKLVTSIEKPGGNLTGITSLDRDQAARQFELIKVAFPGISRVAIISDQTIPGGDEQGLAPIDRANQAAAKAVGIEPHLIKLKDAAELENAFADIVKNGAQAVLVLEVPIPLAARKQIAELAARHRLPSMFPGGQSDAGGVITYGTSVADTWRQFAGISDKILKGEKPGELPVIVLSKRELVINLQAAKAVGATVASEVVNRADRVID
ncbi:ABC transporter substrate-binding protein [Bosea beijingensis]